MGKRAAGTADFAALADEVLTVLAQRHRCLMALDVLMDRYSKWMEDFIARWAWHRLQAADLGHAQQVGWRAFLEAVAHYDLSQLGQPSSCHFRTYLITKLHSRLKDSVRSQRRDQAHYDTTMTVEERLNREVERSHIAEKYNIWSASKLGDPAALAQRHEAELRMADTIGRFDNRCRCICEGLIEGKTKLQIAQELGVSESTVQRLIQTIRTAVQAELEEYAS